MKRKNFKQYLKETEMSDIQQARRLLNKKFPKITWQASATDEIDSKSWYDYKGYRIHIYGDLKKDKLIKFAVEYSPGKYKEGLSEGLSEGFSDLNFKKIIDDMQEIVNLRTVKEKVIGGVKTLMMSFEGILSYPDIQDIEDSYQKYDFDLSPKSHLLSVSLAEGLDGLNGLVERVSPDCSTGAGVIPNGPYSGWNLVRTNHLDDPRKPSNKPRDDGWECDEFENVVKAFLKKRPLGVQDGKYLLEYKNKKGFQSFVIDVNNKDKKITFITIMQLNKKTQGKYNTSGARYVNIGNMNIPD